MEYNERIENIPGKSMQLFGQIFGIQGLVYSGENVHVLPGPTINVSIDGENHPFHFEEIKAPITIIECSPLRAKIEGKFMLGDNNEINFESENTYWVSPFGTWREYFVRIK